MKKPNKAAKPSKAPTQKVRGQANFILDMLKNMDEDVVDMLRQSIEKEMDFNRVTLCYMEAAEREGRCA